MLSHPCTTGAIAAKEMRVPVVGTNSRRPGRRSGAAILEMAILMPLLLLLSFGLVEYGHYFYVKHALQGAAREGARAAVPQGVTNSDVTNAVQKAMDIAGLHNSGYSVAVDPTDVSQTSEGTQVSVTVRCTWGTVGLRPLQLIPGSKQVVGAVTMRKEGI